MRIKELDEELKQNLLDLAWSKKDFRDYKDVVSLDILARAYRNRYLQIEEYLNGIKETFIGDLPDLKMVSVVPQTKTILLPSTKAPSYYRYFFTKIYASTAKVQIDSYKDMKFYTPNEEYESLDKEDFLNKYRDLLWNALRKYLEDPFYKPYEIPTLEEKFKEVTADELYVTAEYINDSSEDLPYYFHLYFGYRANKYSTWTSKNLKRTNKTFCNTNTYGVGELQRLADKILISESAIPSFIQEEVQKQKSKLMK